MSLLIYVLSQASLVTQIIKNLPAMRETWVQSLDWEESLENGRATALVIANILFQQHKRRRYTWISPDDWHRNQIDYILCRQRWKSSIQSAKQDWELTMAQLIAKFRLKLKKVEKTSWPFRYDLNQIPNSTAYTVEVRNRFKGLDLIDRVVDELWTEVRDIVQEIGIKRYSQPR